MSSIKCTFCLWSVSRNYIIQEAWHLPVQNVSAVSSGPTSKRWWRPEVLLVRSFAMSHTVAILTDQNFATSQLVLNSYSDLAHSRYERRRWQGGRRKEEEGWPFALHSINIWSRTVRFGSQGNFLKVESGPNELLSRLYELQKEEKRRRNIQKLVCRRARMK